MAVARPGGCRWAGSAGDDGIFLDVEVGCRADALPILRAVAQRAEAGDRPVEVGQRGVLAEENGVASVAFIDADTPCGAIVRVAPPAGALDAARAVVRSLPLAAAR